MIIRNQKRLIYILLCLSCITISFNVAAVTAAIPVISLELNRIDIEVSKLISYYLIPYGIGALIYAPLTRYLSYKFILGVSMVVYGVACLLCANAQTLETMLYARVLMGVSGSGAIPLGLMIIGEFFEKKVRGRLVGLFFSTSFFAALAGIVCGGLLDWRWLFFIPAAMGLLLAVVLLIFKLDLLNKVHKAQVNYLRVLKKLEIRKVFIFIFVISALYHGVHKWYGVYLSRVYEMDKLTISLFFTISIMGGMIGQLLGGVISDKLSRLTACVLGVAGLAVFVCLLSVKHHLVVLGLVLMLISVFWTVGHNGVSTILTDFSDRDRPAIASLNSSVRFISGGLGFYLSGFFVEKSFGITFLAIGSLLFVLSVFVRQIVPR